MSVNVMMTGNVPESIFGLMVNIPELYDTKEAADPRITRREYLSSSGS